MVLDTELDEVELDDDEVELLEDVVDTELEDVEDEELEELELLDEDVVVTASLSTVSPVGSVLGELNESFIVVANPEC